MIRRWCLGLLLIVGFVVEASPLAAQAPARLSAEKIRKIEDLIGAEMAKHRIPGLSVALVADHALVFSKGFGHADLENRVPARAETSYRLASISKSITAVAALQLVEKGKLDLDAPVQRYVPAFPEKSRPITTRQLLGHLSGIRHYRSEEEKASTRHYDALLPTLDLFKDDPLVHDPGAKFTYSTYGYNLLGCVIEGASGMKYVDYVRAHVFRPAGMETIRPDDVFALIPHRAQGYRKGPDGELRNSPLMDGSNKIPGGGLCASVEDLARFAIAVQKDQLVGPDTRRLMFTRQKTTDGTETAYGLGFNLSAWNGKQEAGHGGAQARVSNLLYMIPEERLAVVLLTNLEGTRLLELARQVAAVMLEPS
jgi:CubicO group peptidase (beta-lactamase class C family)